MRTRSSLASVAVTIYGAALLLLSAGAEDLDNASLSRTSVEGARILAQSGVGSGPPKPGFQTPRGSTPSPGLPEGPSQDARALQGPIQQDSGKVLAGFLKLLPNETKLNQASADLKATCKGFDDAYTQHWYAFHRIKDQAKSCATANHTVQDQQAAGCQGSETLDQCRQKLFKWCTNVKHAKDKQDFIQDSQAVIANTGKVSGAAKEYQDMAKMGLSIYGN